MCSELIAPSLVALQIMLDCEPSTQMLQKVIDDAEEASPGYRFRRLASLCSYLLLADNTTASCRMCAYCGLPPGAHPLVIYASCPWSSQEAPRTSPCASSIEKKLGRAHC